MDPFIGEVRPVGFGYAPRGWAHCNGQLLSLAQNSALYAILGTQFGGDGKTTFQLPNLNGVMPIGHGAGPDSSYREIGEIGGVETVTLLPSQLPVHRHTPRAAGVAGNSNDPQGRHWAQPRYGRAASDAYAAVPQREGSMAQPALEPTGGNSPHYNMPPYLPVYYIIALTGVFPNRP